MDKHITDIDLFEFANDLITDKIQIETIENHIAGCAHCVVRYETEKSMDGVLSSNLSVSETIDVSEKIQRHFTTEPNVQLFDTNGIVYTILGLLGLLAIIQIKDNVLIDSIEGVNIPQLPYVNVIVFAVVGILLLDLVMKYFKQKKQLITS